MFWISHTQDAGKNHQQHDEVHLPIREPSFTPLKINMEHNHGGLEDHFPFQLGDS